MNCSLGLLICGNKWKNIKIRLSNPNSLHRKYGLKQQNQRGVSCFEVEDQRTLRIVDCNKKSQGIKLVKVIST